MRQRDEGYTAVYVMDGQGTYCLPVSEYERVRAEWMRGVAFIDAIGFYGNAVTIKASRIEGVALWTPEQLRLSREDAAAEKAEDAIRGD